MRTSDLNRENTRLIAEIRDFFLKSLEHIVRTAKLNEADIHLEVWERSVIKGFRKPEKEISLEIFSGMRQHSNREIFISLDEKNFVTFAIGSALATYDSVSIVPVMRHILETVTYECAKYQKRKVGASV